MSRNSMNASIAEANEREDQRETARREWLESKAPRYTPGPWEWDGDITHYNSDEEAPWLRIGADGDPVLIGEIHGYNRADALLIAAAPELVEALQLANNVLFLLADEVKALGCKAENVPEKVRAALAKAGVV